MKLLFKMVLFWIALMVAIGLIYGLNMWKWIAVYWIVLTVKNAYDIFSKD